MESLGWCQPFCIRTRLAHVLLLIASRGLISRGKRQLGWPVLVLFGAGGARRAVDWLRDGIGARLHICTSSTMYIVPTSGRTQLY